MTIDNDAVFDSITATLRTESQAIGRLAETADRTEVRRAVETILACPGTVHLSGCGTSAQAAKKIAHTLKCIDCPAAFLTPSDAVHGALGAVRRGDVAVLISKGGNTGEITAMLPSLKTKGAVVIGVTENAESTLGRAADIPLIVRVEREPDEFNMLATASTLAVIALFDAIAIAVMRLKGFSRDDFAVIHPGGAVGERLLAGKS